jgi:polar amino acid transport system substrate-binding protein
MLRRGRSPRLRAVAVAVVVGVVVVASPVLVACGRSEDVADQRFHPATDGQLTVATSLPAPGFWTGSDVTTVDGGFEYGIAVALAERFDLELRLVDAPFDELVAGELGAADMALAQITETTERAEHLAFSWPYYMDDAGVVVPTGATLTDLKTAREQRWAVQRDTVQATLIEDTVRPDEEPVLFDDAVAAIDAVADGRAEAALVDLSTALVSTKGRDDVTTAARFVTNGAMAIAMPPGSENVEVVDAALRAMTADRTIADLEHRYLAPVFETDPTSLPVVRTPDD